MSTTVLSLVLAAALAAPAPAQDPGPVPAAPACPKAPPAPAGLAAPAVTATAVVLRWRPVPAVPGCRVTYAVTDNGQVVASGLAAPSATLTGLGPGTVHLVFVTARNQAGSSGPSTGLALRTRTAAACAAPPEAPTGLASTRSTGTTVALAWAPAGTPGGCGGVTYLIYQDGLPVLTLPTTTAVLDGLTPGTAYRFAVAALDDAGVSQPGPALTVRTPAAVQGPSPAQVLGHPDGTAGPDRPDVP